MTEKVNYYEILLNIENLLYKTSNYIPQNTDVYTNCGLNVIRLEVVNYIYSVPLLKREFLDKITHFSTQTNTNAFKNEIERVKEKIIRFYHIKENDIEKFLYENTPEIFYYPIVGQKQEYFLETEGLSFLYGQYNEDFCNLLRTKYFASLHVEYYILTLNSFGRFYLDNYFAQSYMASAILKVLTDFYFFIDKQIQENTPRLNEDFEQVLANKQVLTEREEEVFTIAQQKKSRKEISNALGINEATVQSHINNIGDKTGIKGLKQIRKYSPKKILNK